MTATPPAPADVPDARGADLAVAAALAVLVLVLFLPAVLGRGVFLERDLYWYWYPHIEVAVQAVVQGSLPVWNPYTGFGGPLLSDPAFQLLYPPTWCNLVVTPSGYYTAYVVSHCWAAGLGVYFLCRHWGLSRVAAAVAGALWTCSGPLLSSVTLFHHFAGAAWLAWVLLAFVRTTARPSPGRAVALGAAAGMQALAGSADLCLMSALAIAWHAAFHIREAADRPGALGAVARTSAIAAAFAFLLSAVQWLPVLGIVSAGSRLHLGAVNTQFRSVHPASLLDVLVPELVSAMAAMSPLRNAVLDGRAPLLVSLYVGAASIPLVGLGLVGPRHPLKGRAGLCSLFFLVVALGRHAPLHGLLASLPPLSMTRYPAKYMLPAALFWSVLVALGVEALLRSRTPAEKRRIAAMAAFALALALAAAVLAWWIRSIPLVLRPWFTEDPTGVLLERAAAKLWTTTGLMAGAGILLALAARTVLRGDRLTAAFVLLLLVDVLVAGRDVNDLAPPEVLRYRPPLVDAMRVHGALARLYVDPSDRERQHIGPEYERGGLSIAGVLGSEQLLIPPIGARWGISGSYDGDFTGMAPRAYAELAEIVDAAGDRGPITIKLLQMGGVTHVSSLRENPWAGLREVGSFPSVYEAPVRLFEVPDPLPRAYVARAARTSEADEARGVLLEPGFDPHYEVLLPPGADTSGEGGAPRRVSPARVERRGVGAVDIEVPGDGWLVLLESYDAGWTARVDGRPAPVVAANLIFCAVKVPAGSRRVEMRYRPPLLRTGAALTSLASVVGAAVLIRGARAGTRNRRAPDASASAELRSCP